MLEVNRLIRELKVNQNSSLLANIRKIENSSFNFLVNLLTLRHNDMSLRSNSLRQNDTLLIPSFQFFSENLKIKNLFLKINIYKIRSLLLILGSFK